MKYPYFLGSGLLLGALLLAGCGDNSTPKKSEPSKTEPPKTSSSSTPPAHSHGKGPNGGVVFDLGKEHAEFTVDHDKKECTILVVTGDQKDAKPLSIVAKEFTVTTLKTQTKEGKEVPPMTIKMLPQDETGDKASKFVGTDPGLGNVADFAGTVLGEIDGKPAKGEFKE